MYSCVKLLVVASAIATAATQYNDGYEIVETDTSPVQIRVAYQGPSAMMGKSAHDMRWLAKRCVARTRVILNSLQCLGTRLRSCPAPPSPTA